MASMIKSAVKLLATLAIFVALFVEIGGGPVPVSRAKVLEGTIFEKANPAMPGFLGKLKARITGKELPPKTIPASYDSVCRAGSEGAVFVKTTDGQTKPFKPLRHCVDDKISMARATVDGPLVPLSTIPGETVWFESPGFQLVPMDMKDLWNEVTSVNLAVFLPWFLAAMLVKLTGIFANIVRWQVLLKGQGLHFGFGWLTASYFVGRYWGILTPSTMGLDGWRLYDTIRLSRRPIECSTAVVVERVIGLVGLLTVILLFMPFAELGGRNLAELLAAMKVPIAAGVFFGILLLLRPSAFTPLVRFLPHPKLRSFMSSSIESITAYSTQRLALGIALACAVFGQLTTMFMYFCNAMALQVEGVTMTQILYASAVMTLGTFLAPSASGEGVRELVFVALLGGKTTAAKAFLVGHLGFWIEKVPLSLPGGWFYLRAPEAYRRVTREDLERLKVEATAEHPNSKVATKP